MPPGSATSPLGLHLHEPVLRDGALHSHSSLREPDGAVVATLRFTVPERFAPLVGETAEAHLLAATLKVMHLGRPLHVHGRVSPVLLRNLEEFMGAWSTWRRGKLHAVPMTADREAEPPPPGDPEAAVSAFSGGLDSAYTIWRHTRGVAETPDRPGPMARRRRRLTHGVLVRGLERLREDDAAWARVCRDQQRTLQSAGVELLPVGLNFRELYPGVRFFNAWGACVAACLTLFQSSRGGGLLPAGANHGHLLVPQPTTPHTDHLLSSAAFRIVHDGADEVRTAKSRALTGWPEALEGLRVCGEDTAGGNCGRCEKCVRTMLGFHVFDLPVPPAFPGEVDAVLARRVTVTTASGAYSSESLLGVAEGLGKLREPWARAVAVALRRYRRRERLKRWRDRGLGRGRRRPCPELDPGRGSAATAALRCVARARAEGPSAVAGAGAETARVSPARDGPAREEPVHIEPLPVRERGDRLELGARLHDPGGPDAELRFELPAEFGDALSDSADPALLGLLFTLMERGRPAVVHGRVSPTLLANLEEFMGAMALWRPRRLTPVSIVADEEAETAPAPGPEQAVCAFSGGLDSCFTAFRHARGLVGRRTRRLTHGVLVEGLERNLPPGPREDAVRDATTRLLDSLGIRPVSVATNFRELHPGHGAYNAWTATITACMALLQGRVRVALMPGSFDWRSLFIPLPTTPSTDPLLSSAAFEVVHDGAEVVRAEKAAALWDWPEARRCMRVCFHSDERGVNCGRCEKCIHTILCFRVMGLPVPDCFPGDVTDEQVRAMAVMRPSLVRSQLDLLRTAEEQGRADESWVDAVRTAIARSQRRLRLRDWAGRLGLGGHVVRATRGATQRAAGDP